MKKQIKTYLSGFFMGAADIVPGVSGGTMAFILGIYEELIKTIASINKDFFKKLFSLKIKQLLIEFNWKFLVLVFAGIFTAILSLSHTLEYYLINQPLLVWSFFTGLIIASIPELIKKVEGSWNKKLVTFFVLGVFIAYLIIGLTPTQTPNSYPFLFFSGVMASMAMILPGISGSFILVLLNKYEYILSAVNNRDIVTIAVVGMGAVVGIITLSKIINVLFKRYHDVTVALLAGFVLGAIRKVWPFKLMDKNYIPFGFDESVLRAILFILLGATVVTVITKLANSKQKTKIKS